MNLYLIRHAIAEEEASSGEDSQRALTEKGAKKMRQIAKGLRMLGVEFDLILSSPYLRARQTAEILSDVFKLKKEIVYSEDLIPMGDPDLLLAEINEKYSMDSLAIVGHEPYLSTFVSLLTAGGTPVELTFKKGGVCRLSTDDLHHSRKATLEWLLTPGVLVEIAER
ncbi:MAG: phosphohistidine phosphatase SixA [Anaerolineales bacterium]|nr:phosphohistidine phosphatase SixA [Anaerolineales bacterium]